MGEEDDVFSLDEFESLVDKFKDRLSKEEIGAMVDAAKASGMLQIPQSKLAPHMAEQTFNSWRDKVVSKNDTREQSIEKFQSDFGKNSMGTAFLKDAVSIFDRASGALAKKLGKEDAADERGMGDPNASILKNVHQGINNSKAPLSMKMVGNALVGAAEGGPVGLISGLASSAVKSIAPAIKGGIRGGSMAKASELADEAATAKSAMIGPAPVTGDIAKEAANLSINKLNVPVPKSTSPLSFTAGESANLSGLGSADEVLNQEAKLVSGARGNDMVAANAPFDARESALSSQHSSATSGLLPGSELTGRAVATNLAQTSEKLQYIFKPAYNKAEASANKAVTTRPIVDDLVAELDSKGLYKVAEDGPTNLAPTSKTSTTIKDVVKLDENGKPIPSTGKDKILRRATGVQSNVEEGNKIGSSLTTKAESWIGGKTPNQAKSSTTKEMKTTLGMKSDGYAASDAVSEYVAKDIANIRNEIAEAGNFSSLKNGLDKLYELRRKSSNNPNSTSGDWETITKAIDAVSKAKVNSLKKAGLQGDWDATSKVYKDYQDLEDIKSAVGTSGVAFGFDIKNINGDQVFDKLIGSMVEKDGGRRLTALQAVVTAEELGIISKGVKSNINQTMMRKLIDKSSEEAQSTGQKIVSADKLYKNIMDTPKQVFDLTMTEDSKRELMRLYIDAAAHSKAASATNRALGKMHNVDKIAQAAHQLKIAGWGTGTRGLTTGGAVAELVNGLYKLVAGKTSNQILRKYAGSNTAGTFSDRVGESLRGLSTFVREGNRAGLSAMRQAGKDAFAASRSKLVPPALSAISSAQDATATEQ